MKFILVFGGALLLSMSSALACEGDKGAGYQCKSSQACSGKSEKKAYSGSEERKLASLMDLDGSDHLSYAVSLGYEAVVKLGGMKCDRCKGKIETAFTNHKKTDKAYVDRKHGNLYLSFKDKNQEMSASEIRKIVQNLGYKYENVSFIRPHN